jgi:hypothetical protein
MLAELIVSNRVLGTTEILLLNHTGCDVGDGDEMCKPVARGHLIAFCSIRTLLIDDSKSDEQCSSGRVAHTCLIFRRHQRKTAERSIHRYLRPPSVVPFSISSFWASPILMPLKPTSSSHRVPVEEVSEALDQRMGSDLR